MLTGSRVHLQHGHRRGRCLSGRDPSDVGLAARRNDRARTTFRKAQENLGNEQMVPSSHTHLCQFGFGTGPDRILNDAPFDRDGMARAVRSNWSAMAEVVNFCVHLGGNIDGMATATSIDGTTGLVAAATGKGLISMLYPCTGTALPPFRRLRARPTWTQATARSPSEAAIGAPDWIRTSDLCLRRAALYPAELRMLRGIA